MIVRIHIPVRMRYNQTVFIRRFAKGFPGRAFFISGSDLPTIGWQRE